jgi:hypothetical protein
VAGRVGRGWIKVCVSHVQKCGLCPQRLGSHDKVLSKEMILLDLPLGFKGGKGAMTMIQDRHSQKAIALVPATDDNGLIGV